VPINEPSPGGKIIGITDADFDHPRVLKMQFVQTETVRWEVSTVRLAKEPESIMDIPGVMRDAIDDIIWEYETMIFKVNEKGERFCKDEITPFHATSYGFYRSNESEDVVKAHDQITQLILEGKLIPVPDRNEESSLQISPAIVTAMVKEDS